MNFDYPTSVHFSCKKCSLCCGDVGDRLRLILLLPSEAISISVKTLRSLSAFVEKVEGFEPYLYKMKKTANGKCYFLEGQACSIYEIRPLICKFYPFYLKNLGDNRYAFSYTEECCGIGRGPKLKKSFFKDLFDLFKEHL